MSFLKSLFGKSHLDADGLAPKQRPSWNAQKAQFETTWTTVSNSRPSRWQFNGTAR
jgi:hypothetical protein